MNAIPKFITVNQTRIFEKSNSFESHNRVLRPPSAAFTRVIIKKIFHPRSQYLAFKMGCLITFDTNQDF